MKDRQEIREKAKRLLEQAEELERSLEEPETREPESGDVYESPVDGIELVSWDMRSIGIDDKFYISGKEINEYEDWEDSVYLGKFNEVYVKVEDVIEALKAEDSYGESVWKLLLSGWCPVANFAKEKLKALSPKFGE